MVLGCAMMLGCPLPPGRPAAPGRPPAGRPPAGRPPAGRPPAGRPPAGRPPAGRPPAGKMPPRGGPRGHKPETPLTGDTAAKVKDAALAKVSGGTIVRVETDSDHGSPYEAHVRKSNGTEVEVLVNKQFQVTDVNAMGLRR